MPVQAPGGLRTNMRIPDEFRQFFYHGRKIARAEFDTLTKQQGKQVKADLRVARLNVEGKRFSVTHTLVKLRVVD